MAVVLAVSSGERRVGDVDAMCALSIIKSNAHDIIPRKGDKRSPYVSIVLIYLLYLTKDLAKKKKITMVKPFARSSGMDILKYSRLPRATPSRWARRIPIRRILFNYLSAQKKIN